MNRKHALTISLAVGVATIAGIVAATKTVHLGSSTAARPAAANSAIEQQTRQLDAAEIALRKALAQKPPKLPRLPAAAGAAPAASAPAAQPRVVYVRPAPIIHHVRRAGGEHEEAGKLEGSEREGGGGFDD